MVSNFLTCVGLPADKQWLSRLKSDWKEEVYKITTKSEQKNTPLESKKSKPNNSNVSSRLKPIDEPVELIEVEPGDEIIDDFDIGENIEENMQEEIED